MSQLTTNASSLLRPEQVNDLVIEPLTKESTAFQVLTLAKTTSHEYRFPRIVADPATAWVAEGEEIPPDDADVDELLVTPKKCAGLTVISNELAADSTPAATAVIGQRIVNSLKRRIDAAFFAATTANGPDGLGSIEPSEVWAGDEWLSADPFLEGLSVAEKVGAQITSWVAHPDEALDLARLKKLTTGSNEPLLSTDAASPTGRVIAGVPLVTSPDCPLGVVYGIPKALAFVVLRLDATVVVDSSAFFTSDRVAVRSVVRVAFGFPHEKAIVAVYKEDGMAS